MLIFQLTYFFKRVTIVLLIFLSYIYNAVISVVVNIGDFSHVSIACSALLKLLDWLLAARSDNSAVHSEPPSTRQPCDYTLPLH